MSLLYFQSNDLFFLLSAFSVTRVPDHFFLTEFVNGKEIIYSKSDNFIEKDASRRGALHNEQNRLNLETTQDKKNEKVIKTYSITKSTAPNKANIMTIHHAHPGVRLKLI